MVDRVSRAGERGGRNAEVLLVPEVDPRLVAHLDRGVEIGEEGGGAPDHDILGLVGQVGGVEIEEVVVGDALAWVAAVEHVPHRLEEGAGREPPVGKAEVRAPGQHRHVDRVLLDAAEETGPLIHAGQCCGRVRQFPVE